MVQVQTADSARARRRRPRAPMPAALRTAGDDTPLGAAVAALSRSMAGQWPSAVSLGVLAAYAAGFGLLAWRLFRWE
jgi:hypothetical protein